MYVENYDSIFNLNEYQELAGTGEKYLNNARMMQFSENSLADKGSRSIYI